MKTFKTTILVFLAAATCAGCVLVPARRSQSHTRATPQCHPSQYWDGSQCRHKGQGQGARKHDGGGKGPGRGKGR